jgi:hypothetical protein
MSDVGEDVVRCSNALVMVLSNARIDVLRKVAPACFRNEATLRLAAAGLDGVRIVGSHVVVDAERQAERLKKRRDSEEVYGEPAHETVRRMHVASAQEAHYTPSEYLVREPNAPHHAAVCLALRRGSDEDFPHYRRRLCSVRHGIVSHPERLDPRAMQDWLTLVDARRRRYSRVGAALPCFSPSFSEKMYERIGL